MTRLLGKIARVEDFAEHAMRAEPPAVSFREIDPAARSAPPPPAFLAGPINAFLARQIYGQISLRATGCFVLRDACAGPTGIAIKDGVAFCANALNHHRPYVQIVARQLNAAPVPVRELAGPLAVLLGPSYEVYGHFLADYLPRLWLLQACGFDLAALRFLVPMRPPGWAMALLHAAGLRPDQLVACRFGEEVIGTDLLIAPTTLRTYERLSASFGTATRFWTQGLHAQAQASTKPAPRIFVSRRGAASGRMLQNRDEIEACAEQAGYLLVQPETLALGEQVALFAGARLIAGEYGSGLHNAVFAAPGTITCALRGTLRDPGCLQTGLGAALGQRTGYVFGRTEAVGTGQRMVLDPSAFRRALAMMERLAMVS